MHKEHCQYFPFYSCNPQPVFFSPCMKMQLCGLQSARCLPVFEQLACPGPVPDAVLFLFKFFLLACLPVSLYTSDEQVVAFERTPALKSQEGKGPGRNIKADMMLYVQSHRWIRLGMSINTANTHVGTHTYTNRPTHILL